MLTRNIIKMPKILFTAHIKIEYYSNINYMMLKINSECFKNIIDN